MPPIRERYNAKARTASAGPLKKKRRIESDPNAEIIDPRQSTENARRQEIFEEMRKSAGAEAPISSKKRKRMDKYIVSPVYAKGRAIVLRVCLRARNWGRRSVCSCLRNLRRLFSSVVYHSIVPKLSILALHRKKLPLSTCIRLQHWEQDVPRRIDP